jgi:gluconolactonase
VREGANARQLASGLAWPEGPTVLDDGRIVFVETYRSHLAVYVPGRGVERFAFTGGGPNATALGLRGEIYVTQNGGVVGPWRAEERRPPSIQRVEPSGRIDVLVTEVAGIALQAPNDLAFGPDGRLYFTDPGRYDPAGKPDAGRVFAVAPGGAGEVLEDGPPSYPNGIVVEPGGGVVWVESYTGAVKRWRQGRVEQIASITARNAVLDGLAVAEDGSLYITGGASGGLYVLGPGGSEVQFLEVGANPTNCAFDGNMLYVTDGGHSGESETPEFAGALWSLQVGQSGMRPFRGSL